MRSTVSFTHLTAGFIAVMVGFISSGVLVFQAAAMAGANAAEMSSWLFALGSSIAITCIGLSWYYRMPILTGWSTPGAALLVSSLAGVSMPEAVGAFIFAAALTVFVGVTGWFERMMHYLPRSLTSAMLAGILLHFGMNLFLAIHDQTLLVGAMLLTYLLSKRLFPRYVLLLVFLVGICVAKLTHLLPMESIHLAFTTPHFTWPTFSTASLFGVGIPLFIVTMASQNLPGIAILNAEGFHPSVSGLMIWIGLANLIFAPFGCFSICLTALTAAICASEETDPNPAHRFKATLFSGLCWLCIGVFGTTIVALFFAFPKAFVLALTGLALLSTIGHSLKNALEDEAQREPAVITLLISASGITFWGVGAAFWGLLGGIVAAILLHRSLWTTMHRQVEKVFVFKATLKAISVDLPSPIDKQL